MESDSELLQSAMLIQTHLKFKALTFLPVATLSLQEIQSTVPQKGVNSLRDEERERM